MLGALHHGLLSSFRTPVVSSGTWKVRSGRYVGTGSSLAITGLGMRPQFIIIKASGSTANDDPVIAWSGMNQAGGGTPAAAVISPSTAPATGIITSYDVDGFTLANNTLVNTSGQQYYWTAIAGSGDELASGSYVGNSVDGATPISGLTFQPELVFIRRRNLTTNFVTMKHAGMSGDTSYVLGNLASLSTNLIQQLLSDGAEVGASSNVNTSTVTYDWIAMRPPSGYGAFSYYIGTGTDDLTPVTGLAFRPEFLLIKGNINQEAILRVSAHTGDDSSALQNSVANGVNRIQAINSDGFQVGSNVAVNSGSTVYHYAALRST